MCLGGTSIPCRSMCVRRMSKKVSFVTLSIISTAYEGIVFHYQTRHALDEVQDKKAAVCISHHRHYRTVAVPLSTSNQSSKPTDSPGHHFTSRAGWKSIYLEGIQVSVRTGG